MKLSEIIREQIRILDMQGKECFEFIASPEVMKTLGDEMKSEADYSDVAVRLMGMEKKIDRNIAANEFRIRAR